MSFMDYIKSRDTRTRAVVRLGDYEEKLSAEIGGLVLRPDHRLREARRNIVNLKEIGDAFSVLRYPFSEEFLIAIRTADTKKISHAHTKFRQWVGDNGSAAVDSVETALFHYLSRLHDREFTPDDADAVQRTALAESRSLLERMANSVELAVSKIPSWKNHTIVVNAISPDKGWAVTQARVEIGDAFRLGFTYSENATGFIVSEVTPTEGFPPSLVEDFQSLLTLLRNSPKFNKIMTLYMVRPLTERRFFEMAQRDISLGIEAVLPGHVTLAESVEWLPKSDIWKVRVDEKYLRANGGQFTILGDEAPIKWIERLENEK